METNESLVLFSAHVVKELEEMKKLDMRVSKKTLEKAKDLELMAEYESMRASECADLLRDLY